MKLLIIGSEGFIGSHCVEYFLNTGLDVYGIDFKDIPRCNYNYSKILPQETNNETLLKSIQPDVCLFAAGSASVNSSYHYPLIDLKTNSLHVFYLLDSIRKYSPNCKFINLSSAAVYGNPALLPVNEESPVQPISPYGWHKYYSELICKEFSTIYNIQTCSIRPFSVYGPRQTKLLFWDIYQKTRNTKSIELFGTGNETRDYIFITDMVKAIHLIISKAVMSGESYNIASGESHSIAFISQLFLKTLNYKGALCFNHKTKPGDPNNWSSDINKIKEMGYSQSINISTGLTLYSKWLKENE